MDFDLSELLADAQARMLRAVEVCGEHLAKIRTGRASTGIIEDLKVDYYGAATPLKQMATLSVPDPRTILIQPFDPTTMDTIERAIMQSDLGMTPSSTGDNSNPLIRLTVPELSEDRRKDLVRVAKKEAEDGRIAIRNIRRDVNDTLKKNEKAGEVSEDESRRGQDDVQKKTDQFIEKVDKLLAQKEADLLQV